MKVAIIGSRALPVAYAEKVQGVVGGFLARGYRVCHGGAMGADHFVLQALLNLQAAQKGILFPAWESVAGFPLAVRPDVEKYLAVAGGCFPPTISLGARFGGASLPQHLARKALLMRNVAMVNAANILVAFLHGESRGSSFTIKKACEKGLRVLVVLSGSTQIPQIPGGRWVALQKPCMGVAMHYFKKGAKLC
jgi:hypothetical protein